MMARRHPQVCSNSSCALCDRIPACAGEFSWRNAWPYCTLINNFSQAWALYVLMLFYVATHDELKPLQPLRKFVTIKLVVFFSFWQGLGITLLSALGILRPTQLRTYSEKADFTGGLQDFVICLEMFFAAVGFAWSFPPRDYMTGEPPGIWQSCYTLFDFTDVMDDVGGAHPLCLCSVVACLGVCARPACLLLLLVACRLVMTACGSGGHVHSPMHIPGLTALAQQLRYQNVYRQSARGDARVYAAAVAEDHCAAAQRVHFWSRQQEQGGVACGQRQQRAAHGAGTARCRQRGTQQPCHSCAGRKSRHSESRQQWRWQQRIEQCCAAAGARCHRCRRSDTQRIHAEWHLKGRQ